MMPSSLNNLKPIKTCPINNNKIQLKREDVVVPDSTTFVPIGTVQPKTSQIRPPFTILPSDLQLAASSHRHQAIMATIDQFRHAHDCLGCNKQNCDKLRKALKHYKVCQIKASPDPAVRRRCRVCTTVLALAVYHARRCTAGNECTIMGCRTIRSRILEAKLHGICRKI